MKFSLLVMTSIAGALALTSCGSKDDIPNIFSGPNPVSNPAVLTVGAIGTDGFTAPKNTLDFDTVSGNAVAWDMTYDATENRKVQGLIVGSSSPNTGCSIGDATATLAWTPDGGATTTAKVGDVVIAGDDYSIVAGTHYKVHFAATVPAGCASVLFNLVVITASR